MIRLLLVLLIIAGTMYLLLFKQTDEKKPELIYQENLEKVEGLEQQMLQDAQDLQQKVDEMAQ